MGRRKPIPNLVKFPGENSCAVFWDASKNRYEEVRDAFMAFLHLAFPMVDRAYRTPGGDDAPLVPDIGEFYPHGFMATAHQMTPEQRAAANELYVKIGEAIRAAYKHGLDHGRDLLAGLAKGEISLSDYNQGVQTRSSDDAEE